MPFFTCDLHLHTVLSPCAEMEMFPEFIIEQAIDLGLELIAVTDHNSAENVEAMINMAAGTDLIILPGMELQTREEVHLVCLFDTLEQVMAWQAEVYEHLPDLENKEDTFGVQVILDAEGEPVGYNERLLLTSTSFSVEQVVARMQTLGGLCIPAHVDRPAYSLIANLGFIPPDLPVHGVEISPLVDVKQARAKFPQLKDYSLVASSDAHRLDDMMCRTTLKIKEATTAEIGMALAGEGERGVWVDGIRSGKEA